MVRNRFQCVNLHLYFTLLSIAIPGAALISGCAGSNETPAEMHDHFDAMERQQLLELESEDEARRLAMRRPPKPVDPYEVRETERNKRYQTALAAARRRGGANLEYIPPARTATAPDTLEDQSWQTLNAPHPVTGTQTCIIQSGLFEINNGGLETRAQIIVTTDSVMLKTNASLDPQAGQAGIQIDDGELFALELYPNEVVGAISDQYRQLLIKIALGNTLTASFRYQPHRAADNHRFSIPVSGFARLLDTLKNCE